MGDTKTSKPVEDNENIGQQNEMYSGPNSELFELKEQLRNTSKSSGPDSDAFNNVIAAMNQLEENLTTMPVMNTETGGFGRKTNASQMAARYMDVARACDAYMAKNKGIFKSQGGRIRNKIVNKINMGVQMNQAYLTRGIQGIRSMSKEEQQGLTWDDLIMRGQKSK